LRRSIDAATPGSIDTALAGPLQLLIDDLRLLARLRAR